MLHNSHLIIIATYNESANIAGLIAEIFNVVPDTHILVIDDNSPDKTYTVVENLIATKYSEKLFLIKRAGKLGLGTAYINGFNWGISHEYKIIMHMDADFSHNPKYIPDFFNEIQNYDLVLGSRYIEGGGVKNWSLLRKIISKGGSLYSRLILGMPIYDITGGFKCFRAEVLQNIDFNNLISTGFGFQIETTYKIYLHKFKIKEVPIIFEERRAGKSKMSSKIFIEALWLVIKLRFKYSNTML